MDNEDTHEWVLIEDGQTLKKCSCGTRQADDGSVYGPDGTYLGTCVFPACPRTRRAGGKS